MLELLRVHLGLTLRYAEGETEVPRASPHALETLPPPPSTCTASSPPPGGAISEPAWSRRALEGIDARHAPFAAEARRLAEGFRMKRLRQWLEGFSGSP